MLPRPGLGTRRHFKYTGTTNAIAIDLDGPSWGFYLINQGPNGVMIGDPSISGSLASLGTLVPAGGTYGPETYSKDGYLLVTVSGTAVVSGYIIQ